MDHFFLYFPVLRPGGLSFENMFFIPYLPVLLCQLISGNKQTKTKYPKTISKQKKKQTNKQTKNPQANKRK